MIDSTLSHADWREARKMRDELLRELHRLRVRLANPLVAAAAAEDPEFLAEVRRRLAELAEEFAG
jgi:hypothetical protein